MGKYRKLKGGEHKWDGRYTDVPQSFPQPLNENDRFEFGKYKGKHYLDKSIPNNYISWILNNWSNLSIINSRKLNKRI